MGQASEPLASFLEQMMHLYQIENVVSFIGGAKAKMDPAITKQGMNPLGEFQGLKSVSSFASEDIVSLFQDILIDLPCGVYFRKFIDKSIEDISKDKDQNQGMDKVTVEDIQRMMENESSQDIKMQLKNIWLSEFHKWIMANCNPSTQEEMSNILKAESDWETLQIIYNSFGK